MTYNPKVRLDWGVEGLKFALEEKDIVVIVDVLRFSSTVTTAIANGFIIYPVSNKEKGIELAKSIGAEMSGPSGIAKYTLSPQSFLNPPENDNEKVVLYSPNGATCAEIVKEEDIAYFGCLLNSKAVGEQVTAAAKEMGRNVSVIGAGEIRTKEVNGRLEYLENEVNSKKVFAVEDYLGCGAIISYTSLSRNSEAVVAELAFQASKNKLTEFLLNSYSGQYLVQTNRKADVDHSSHLNLYNVIPIIHKGRIEKLL